MRNFKTRRMSKNLEVDINSLLDILIILLVFLLKSYNPNSMKMNLVKNLKPPAINILKSAKKNYSLQVNEKMEVFWEKEKFGVIGEKNIYLRLKEKLRKLLLKAKKTPKINLYFDERVSYGAIKDIMDIFKENGVKKIKLILVGRS